MAQKRRIETSISAYFALCIGLCILVICTNANIINEDDGEANFLQECKRYLLSDDISNKKSNENTKDWYAVLLKSKPQFQFERDPRFHGKPTFIRFGKRDFDAYDPNFFNIK